MVNSQTTGWSCILLTVTLLLLSCNKTSSSADTGVSNPDPSLKTPSKDDPLNQAGTQPASDSASSTSAQPDADTDGPLNSEDFRLLDHPTIKGVIAQEKLARTFSHLSNEGSWVPSDSQVLQLEAGLKQHLQSNPPRRSPKLSSKLDDYVRQYAGLIVDGKNHVYASFLCDGYGQDYRTSWLEVSDGGDCFFQVLYNLEDRSYVWVRVNGEA